MAFNNVPANGWPQLKQLEELAEKVGDTPTFTSDDRDFLDTWESVLPISDEVDPGQYVLTATKSELGATYSWEKPETGIIDYSTTEQNTGQKWIDGKDIYVKTISLAESDFIKTNNWFWQKDIEPLITDYETIVKIYGVAIIEFDGSKHLLPFGSEAYYVNNSDKNIKFADYYRNVIFKSTPYNDSEMNFTTKNLAILKCNITIAYTKATT